MSKLWRAAAVAGAIGLTLAATGALQAKQPESSCFYPSDWRGWRPSPDSRSLYIRVHVSDIYRLDLAAPCPELQFPQSHLVTNPRGNNLYCGPLDFDMRVAPSPRGPAIACIVKSMTKLTPAEAKALPDKLKP